MRKLDRTLAITPPSLSGYSYLTKSWSQFLHKASVWIEINKFQDKLCVYCEGAAEQGKTNGHIEHFFNKGNPSFVHLTFVWSNLFGCCIADGHCGHYKDQVLIGGIKRVYDPNKLIKPDIEDPEEYLQFLDSGKIREKDGLDGTMSEKAQETIKALNLDCSELNSSREKQIDRYRKRILALSSLDDFDLLAVEYQNIYNEAMGTFHRTALKQAIPW
ncbi:retron Ec78 anti-phage system effector HNH endonuclease PtuB [Pectobacterium sp. CHL-2024]|uniref:retron Ec78 anti-phage system effector HNH endonuclease PtuB n=1 Tax=Pectobacterium sp. CHL-2024 TaxID=3377079 RepID=UPI0038025A6C